MDATKPKGEGTVDAAALAEALSTLGLLYGARQALAGCAAGASDDADAIRTFIKNERSHLLASYDLEALVALVLAARKANTKAPASIEQFTP